MQKVVAIAPNPGSVCREEKGPVKVYDSLYLGSRLDARNVKKLKALGITAVVDCAPEYKTIDRLLAKQAKQKSSHEEESVLKCFRFERTRH